MFLSACSTMSSVEKNTKRAELDAMAEAAITGLVERDETLQQKIDDSLGYAVANMKVTKVPIVGAGGGEGVFVNNKTKKRTYFTVSRFDIGGGWGARSYKVLLVLDSQEAIDRLDKGTWEFQAGVEASAGTASAEGSSGALNAGYTVHVLSDGGASATATARVIRIKVNSELTGED
jgi:lipid-binding SYLF domain-containing protein